MWEDCGSSLSLAGLLTLVTAGLALCYDLSPRFKYHFKFVVYIVTVMAVQLLSIPFSLIRPKDPRNAGIPMAISYKLVTSLLGVTWDVQNAELLEKNSSCVIVCNHQSMLDVLGMAALWPAMKKCVGVAKHALMYFPVFGQYAWLCGTVFIDRSKGTESRAKINKSAQAAKDNDVKIWIFPEGHRHKGPALLPFKKGAFYIAMYNKLPIIPVVIGPYTFVDDHKKIFDSGTATIKVLPAIEPEEFGENVQELLDKTYKLMQTEFDILSRAQSRNTDGRNQTIFSPSFNPTSS